MPKTREQLNRAYREKKEKTFNDYAEKTCRLNTLVKKGQYKIAEKLIKDINNLEDKLTKYI